MKSSLDNVSADLPANFFAQDEFLLRSGDMSRVVDVEEAEKWDKVLDSDRLNEDDYLKLLELPCWELSDFPYFLNGLRIFNIYYHHTVESEEEPIKISPVHEVLTLLYIAYDEIKEGRLKYESISIKLDHTVDSVKGILSQISPRDFLTHKNNFSVKLKPSFVLAWAFNNRIQLPQPLLNALCLYQNCSSSCRNDHFNKIYYIKTAEALSPKVSQKLILLAAAQAIWYIKPNMTKSDLVDNPVFKCYGLNNKPYTGTSKHLPSVIKLVDPRGPNRSRGRPSESSDKSLTRPGSLVHIPGLLTKDKIDICKLKLVFATFFKVLRGTGAFTRHSDFWSHPLFNFYLQFSHPVVIAIFNCWLNEILLHETYHDKPCGNL